MKTDRPADEKAVNTLREGLEALASADETGTTKALFAARINEFVHTQIQIQHFYIELLADMLLELGVNPLDYEVVVQRHDDGLGSTTYLQPRVPNNEDKKRWKTWAEKDIQEALDAIGLKKFHEEYLGVIGQTENEVLVGPSPIREYYGSWLEKRDKEREEDK